MTREAFYSKAARCWIVTVAYAGSAWTWATFRKPSWAGEDAK